MLPSLCEEMETSTLLGPLKSANQNYWSSGLALLRDPTEKVSSSPHLEMETDPVFEMLCFLVILNCRRWTKFVNPTILNNVNIFQYCIHLCLHWTVLKSKIKNIDILELHADNQSLWSIDRTSWSFCIPYNIMYSVLFSIWETDTNML
jgi:hypothetical protein